MDFRLRRIADRACPARRLAVHDAFADSDGFDVTEPNQDGKIVRTSGFFGPLPALGK
jgi:hypothetical protein